MSVSKQKTEAHATSSPGTRPQGRPNSTRRRVAGALATLLLLGLSVAGWYLWRPRPGPQAPHTLHPGVTYERIVRTDPAPAIIHVVEVDLEQPGLEWLVTPPIRPGLPWYSARTTTEFLDEFELDLAFNGGWFWPCRLQAPWDHDPSSGDPVMALGLTAFEGQLARKTPWMGQATAWFGRDGSVTFGAAPDEAWHALSGAEFLIRDGRPISGPYPNRNRDRYARHAIGLDRDRTRFLAVIVDGKQPPYSEGLTRMELIDLLIQRGVSEAIRLDEGGSVTLTCRDDAGHARVMNTPIHTRIPGRQRPVATHYGLRIRPETERR